MTQGEYAMFEHWRKYKSVVLPEYRYEDRDQLIAEFDVARWGAQSGVRLQLLAKTG